MSQKYFTGQWEAAQRDLTAVLRIERPLTKPKPVKDRHTAYANVSLLYLKYIEIYNGLQQCYDYMVHPQKRILIGRLLEGVAGRLIELRLELVRVNMNEYCFLGAMCQDLKVDPSVLEITLPKSVAMKRVENLRRRVQLLEYILASMTKGAGNRSTVEDDVYTVEEAVALIQKNERGFQARKKWKAYRKKGRGRKKLSNDECNLDKVNVKGILRFQSIWRGHQARKRIIQIRNEMDMSLGMLMPPQTVNIQAHEMSMKSNAYKKALENDDAYRGELVMSTEVVLEERRPQLERNMKAEIMQWILEYRDLMLKLPDFPNEEEDGGSLALLAQMTPEEFEEYIDDLMEKMAAEAKGDKKEQPKEKKPKQEEKKPKKGEEEYKMTASKFVETPMAACANEYASVWRRRREEENPQQQYDHNLLKEEVERNVETIVRKEVDEAMRVELDRLQKAVEMKKPLANRPIKPKKPKKPKKRKAPKELTKGIAVEELFKELVMEGIIKKVPEVSLADFLGHYNLLSPTDSPDIECLPDLGDIRKMMFDFGVLPMSSAEVHAQVPLLKSMLLVGPHCSGKRMLVHALCYELGATFFDLSAENLVDKFEGKRGQMMLMDLLWKVAKEMEPSIIWIDNCDMMHSKKLPPEQAEMKPARFKKDITKFLKFITPEDRIMLIGTTKFPFKANKKAMFSMYQRLIFIYPPTHQSRFILWESMIRLSKGIINERFCLTSLTKVSQGFTAGIIESAIREVLTEKRRSKQHIYPIKPLEFVERLALYDPVYRSELQAFRDWLAATPLAVRKAEVLELEEADREYIGLI